MTVHYDRDNRFEDEGPDLVPLHDKWRVARKQHDCSWCKKPIPVGEKYLSLAYTEDGKFVHDHIHLCCRYGGAQED